MQKMVGVHDSPDGNQLLLVPIDGGQPRQWFDPMLRSLNLGKVRVSLLDEDGGDAHGERPAAGVAATSRPVSVTNLPWQVVTVAADLAADMNQFAQRRRIIIAGLGTLALLVVAASALVFQSVSRELAAAQLKSDFVSAVSHEFRTPLTSMRQFTEILTEDDNLPAGERRKFYEAQGRDTFITDRVVDTHVLNLRKKIEPYPAKPRFIKSVRGMGYRFDG
jgi:signal transduction histidine kinase